MGWISPTGYQNSNWADEENIYDGDLGTSGQTGTRYHSCELTVSAVSCDKIRLYSDNGAAGQANGKIEVYYGSAWHTLHDGLIPAVQWVEYELGSTQTVTIARLTLQDFITFRVFEFEFNDVGEAPEGGVLPSRRNLDTQRTPLSVQRTPLSKSRELGQLR